jgi:hypothetical protein
MRLELRAPRLTLAAKFTAAALTLVFVTAASIGFMIVSFESRELQDELQHHGYNVVDLLAHSATYGVYTENKELLRDVALGASRFPGVAYARFAAADGRVLTQAAFGDDIAIPAQPTCNASINMS